jgi:hypothetical protein
LRDFFGQLLRIFVVDIPESLQEAERNLNSQENGEPEDDRTGADSSGEEGSPIGLCPNQWIYAVMRSVKIDEVDTYGINYYQEMGPLEVVDINTIQCVVGRIQDRKRWAIVDRSGFLAQLQLD